MISFLNSTTRNSSNGRSLTCGTNSTRNPYKFSYKWHEWGRRRVSARCCVVWRNRAARLRTRWRVRRAARRLLRALPRGHEKSYRSKSRNFWDEFEWISRRDSLHETKVSASMKILLRKRIVTLKNSRYSWSGRKSCIPNEPHFRTVLLKIQEL